MSFAINEVTGALTGAAGALAGTTSVAEVGSEATASVLVVGGLSGASGSGDAVGKDAEETASDRLSLGGVSIPSCLMSSGVADEESTCVLSGASVVNWTGTAWTSGKTAVETTDAFCSIERGCTPTDGLLSAGFSSTGEAERRTS
jgi:hypothetical protein